MQKHNLSFLWRQHNEHRIVVPELVFWADMVWLNGRLVLPSLLNVLVYVATVAFSSIAIWRSGRRSRSSRCLAVTCFLGLCGWPLCTLVIGVPFLLQWTIVEFALVCGLLMLPNFVANASRWYVVGVLSCGLIATFSSANGMLIWLVFLGGALALGCRRRQLWILISVALFAIGTFFFKYNFASHAGLGLGVLRHPILLAGFIMSYLSMPFGVIRSPIVGLAFGSLHVILWIIVLRTFRSQRTGRDVEWRCMVLPLGYAVFTFLTASATATGRLSISEPGFGGAKAGRYVTLALINWGFLCSFLILSGFESRWRKWLLMVPAVLLFMQVRLLRWQRTNDKAVEAQRVATVSLASGMREPTLLTALFPSPGFVNVHLALLDRHRLSIYSLPDYRAVGEAAPPVSSVTQRPCLSLTRVTHLLTGVELQGSIRVPGCERFPFTKLLAIDSRGRIAGYGSTLRQNRWVAFVPNESRSSTLLIAQVGQTMDASLQSLLEVEIQ